MLGVVTFVAILAVASWWVGLWPGHTWTLADIVTERDAGRLPDLAQQRAQLDTLLVGRAPHCHHRHVTPPLISLVQEAIAQQPNWRRTEIVAALKEAVRAGDPKRVSRACNW